MVALTSPMQSPAQVEHLVRQLYLPTNTPDETKTLQNYLQDIQSSCTWELADELLKSNDPNVRFFATLTFTVKINQSGSSLEEDDLKALLDKLLAWLIRLVDQNETFLVLRKLCTTLVTYFVLPNAKWTRCIRHVLCCLHSRSVVNETSLDAFPTTTELTSSTDSKVKTLVLMLATIMAQDASRIDHSSAKFDYCHRRVTANLDDAIAVMKHEFELLTSNQNEYLNDVLQCYLSWMEYVGEVHDSSRDEMPRLKKLLLPAIKCLHFEQTFEPAAQFFIDFFTGKDTNPDKDCVKELCAFLNSPWATQRISEIEQGELDGEHVLLGQLIFSFGQAIPRLLMDSNTQFKPFMTQLHRLTGAQTYESIEQSLCNAVVDFWEAFCATAPIVDPNDEKDQLAFVKAKADWTQAIEELVLAAALPLGVDGDLERIGSDDVFSEFRSRVHGAIESSYAEFGVAVLEKLVALILDTDLTSPGVLSVDSARQYPGRLENILYCISGLSDSLESLQIPGSIENNVLSRLFSSQTYANLTNFNIACPEKLRKRAVAVIGDLEGLFRSQPGQLISVFDVLFRALDYPGLGYVSARSIYLLAENNRNVLSPKIEDFLLASERLLLLSSVEGEAKNFIVSSVASIAQAVEDVDLRYKVLMRICDQIQKSMELVLTQDTGPAQADGEHEVHALEAMGYLEALGKAFQAPDTRVISLDDNDDDDDYTISQQVPRVLTEVHSRLIRLMELILTPHRQSGPLLAATCDVLRTGYRELQPGPFTFGPEITADFITAIPISNPSLDKAILTAASFLNSKVARQTASAFAVLRLLKFVYDVIDNVKSPDADPELSFACIEFIYYLVQSHMAALKDVPEAYISALLSFSIRSLYSANVPPKKSAAHLWRTIFTTFNQAPRSLTPLLLAAGPHLAEAFVQAFGGNATRSELPWLTEAFRKMVSTQRDSKIWIETALFSEGFPSSRVSDSDKQRCQGILVGLPWHTSGLRMMLWSNIFNVLQVYVIDIGQISRFAHTNLSQRALLESPISSALTIEIFVREREDIQRLFATSKPYDCQVILENAYAIKAHKSVLSSQCDFFRAQIEGPSASKDESVLKTISIGFEPPYTIIAVIRHCYGYDYNLGDILLDLNTDWLLTLHVNVYLVAEKYGLELLKEQVNAEMRNLDPTLDVNNRQNDLLSAIAQMYTCTQDRHHSLRFYLKIFASHCDYDLFNEQSYLLGGEEGLAHPEFLEDMGWGHAEEYDGGGDEEDEDRGRR